MSGYHTKTMCKLYKAVNSHVANRTAQQYYKSSTECVCFKIYIGVCFEHYNE